MKLYHVSLFILALIALSWAMKDSKSRPKSQERKLAFLPYSRLWVPDDIVKSLKPVSSTTTTPIPSTATTTSVNDNSPDPAVRGFMRFLSIAPSIPTKSKAKIVTRPGKKIITKKSGRHFRITGPIVTRFPWIEIPPTTTREDLVSFETDEMVFAVNPLTFSNASPVNEESPTGGVQFVQNTQKSQHPISPIAPPVVIGVSRPAPPVVTRATLPPLTASPSSLPNNVPVSVIRNTSVIPPRTNTTLIIPNNTALYTTHISKEHTGGKWVHRLCGYPATCDFDQCVALNITTDPLYNCEVPGAAVAIGLTAVLLGLTIVLGNLLMPIVVWKQPDMRNRHNYIKVSLAISDMIVGAFLLFITLPSMIWLRNSTESEILEVVLKTERNSWRAILAGSLFVLAQEASLLHLVFLSVERFIAIKWPFWHRQRSTRTVLLTLASLWVVSILVSFSPAVFPHLFEYNLAPVALSYMMSALVLKDGTLGYHILVFSVITFVIPFIAMVIFTSLTGFIVWRKFRSSKRKRIVPAGKANDKNSRSDDHVNTVTKSNHSSDDVFEPVAKAKVADKNRMKPEVSVFITIVIMITAFSLTLIPLTVVLILFNTGYYNCTNYAVPFFASLFAALLNGFVNVIIYSARDNRFRKAVSETFFPKKIRFTFSVGRHHSTPSKGNDTAL